MRRGVALAVAVGLGLFGACSSVAGPDQRDGVPSIETDSRSYRFEGSGAFLELDIPYRYTNNTDGTVSVVNCNGSFALRLERKSHHSWITAWQPAIPLCLSSPIVISPGATFSDTLYVYGALPGGRLTAGYDPVPPNGRYRIVWVDGHQVSNEFALGR